MAASYVHPSTLTWRILDRRRSAAIGAYRPSPRAALYKKKVENLAAALNEPSAAAEAGEIIRSLIDRIVLTPVCGMLKVVFFGDLATLVRFSEARKRTNNSAGSTGEPALLSVVAGVGFEPTTFRL